MKVDIVGDKSLVSSINYDITKITQPFLLIRIFDVNQRQI